MTGTASEFLTDNENIIPEVNSFDLLSSWLFGKINASCILKDIDQHGCVVLMPFSQSIPTGAFKLIIMFPDAPKKVHTILSARVSMVEGAFSARCQRVKVTFESKDDDFYGEINLLKAAIDLDDQNKIRCNILNA